MDLMSMTFDELNSACLDMGEKKFRAKQIYEWFHLKLVSDYDEMSNLSKALRDKLKTEYPIPGVKEVKRYVSKIDGTMKFLFELNDGHIIESVMMRYKHGNSVCISSQVGCRMGCRFCASTLDGLIRNLTPSEMLLQVYEIQKAIGERVSNIVVMGSGEPFDNFDNLIRFIRLVTDENGLNISQRNITVSTCGIVEKIREFADLNLQVTLAISIHAPIDSYRQSLMPIANKYTVKEIMDACHYYLEKNNRRITFEYSLVKGANDSEELAIKLSELLKGMLCHVNLIPVNPIKERDYEQSEATHIERFKNTLEKNHINVTIRREMGRDIAAACGQLRRDYKQGGTS
ncbi:MAG: 23S rRNA (adenine(2503)-C(2))-methyltransferase RlmN [Lachnospiraceae bacterium]|nr:23S rRNA (adenine(2503)-C(2))-methyltransferase RlmN [Lachnospiraceae bacterium]